MHRGVNWVIYLEPDSPTLPLPTNWDQISYYPDEKFWWLCHRDRKWLSFSSLHLIVSGLKAGLYQSQVLCWHRKPRGRDFKTLWSIIAFISGITAQCAAFYLIESLRRTIPITVTSLEAITISFRVIMIFTVFISPWYNRLICSLMLLLCNAWWILWKCGYWWEPEQQRWFAHMQPSAFLLVCLISGKQSASLLISTVIDWSAARYHGLSNRSLPGSGGGEVDLGNQRGGSMWSSFGTRLARGGGMNHNSSRDWLLLTRTSGLSTLCFTEVDQ